MTAADQFTIIQEDATRFMPHDPTGVEYEHFVYAEMGHKHPLTGAPQKTLVCRGTKAACEAFISLRLAAL
jgi:hypothetical protein